MLRWLILLLIAIPALEIWGLISVGRWLGAVPTVLMVVVTGVVGGYLARNEGMKTWQLANHRMKRGKLPGDEILDGISILSGGLLLLTPGFFTDFIGFLLLVPYTRAIVKLGMKKWLIKRMTRGDIMWRRF
ncbi:FxsA family protein [Mechercharimyces sp. CAU 1602]|uniref:FxsA family protein n=1 Tax=Mechercharimyces sp. CAU 1602 TaxID=2973933 RepID=UPI0021634315|nr:FxsA family protein [Mechercharimyces sp. CAU 1602]MCS1351612.1 membrane protein FxsA [Mechercharimyces sp. CAU 1602]